MLFRAPRFVAAASPKHPRSRLQGTCCKMKWWVVPAGRWIAAPRPLRAPRQTRQRVRAHTPTSLSSVARSHSAHPKLTMLPLLAAALHRFVERKRGRCVYAWCVYAQTLAWLQLWHAARCSWLTEPFVCAVRVFCAQQLRLPRMNRPWRRPMGNLSKCGTVCSSRKAWRYWDRPVYNRPTLFNFAPPP